MFKLAQQSEMIYQQLKKHQKLLSNSNFIETYNIISNSILKLYSDEKL